MRRKELRSFFIVGVILLWGLPMVDRLRAQGEVSFIARRDFAAGIGPSAVTAADFNNDGRLDLAVANYY